MCKMLNKKNKKCTGKVFINGGGGGGGGGEAARGSRCCGFAYVIVYFTVDSLCFYLYNVSEFVAVPFPSSWRSRPLSISHFSRAAPTRRSLVL